MIFLPAIIAENDGNYCGVLQGTHKRNRILTDVELQLYCENECDFIRRIDCSKYLTVSSEPWFGTFFTIKRIREEGRDVKVPWFSFSVGASLYGQLWAFFLPYLFGVVPILLQWTIIGSDNARSASKRGGLIFFNVMLWILFTVYCWGNWSAWVSYTTYAYISGFSTVHGRMFSELILSFFGMLALIGLSLLESNWFIQLIGGLAISVLMFGIFFRAVGKKSESERVSVLTSINSLWMASSFLNFLLQQLAAENAAIAVLQLGVYAVLPFGYTTSFATNSIIAAADLSDQIKVENEDISIGFFVGGLVVYWTMYFLSRAAIGAMVLSRLQFDWNIDALSTGLYSYSIDIFNPFTCVIMSIFDRDHRSSRQFMYGCLMIGLMSFELRYGQEMLVLRIVMWGIDAVVVQSGLADASRFLECDVNLSGIAFPKIGAFPFASLDQLSELRKSVYRLILETSAGGETMRYSGVGTVIGTRDSANLITVRHNLLAKQCVRFGDGFVEDVKGLRVLGTSCDPAVSMMLLSRPEKVGNISMLALRETRSVRYLFMLSPEGMFAPVTSWNFDRKGDLHATISLKRGDSGSPIVAVLDDGTLRFAGTVSRGTASEGIPNIISSVACDDDNLTGSPGVDAPYLELRNVVTNTDWRIVKSIEEALEFEVGQFESEFPGMLEYWDEKRKDFKWEDIPPDGPRPGKKRIKSYRKDSATRKRGFMSLLQASTLSDEQKAVAEYDFDNKVVRRFNIERKQLRPRAGIGFVRGVD